MKVRGQLVMYFRKHIFPSNQGNILLLCFTCLFQLLGWYRSAAVFVEGFEGFQHRIVVGGVTLLHVTHQQLTKLLKLNLTAACWIRRESIWNFVLLQNLWLYDLCRWRYLSMLTKFLFCRKLFCVNATNEFIKQRFIRVKNKFIRVINERQVTIVKPARDMTLSQLMHANCEEASFICKEAIVPCSMMFLFFPGQSFS